MRSQNKASEEQSKQAWEQGKQEATNARDQKVHTRLRREDPRQTHKNQQAPKAQSSSKKSRNKPSAPPLAKIPSPSNTQAHRTSNPTQPKQKPKPQKYPRGRTPPKTPPSTQCPLPLPIAVLFFPFFLSRVMRASLPGGGGWAPGTCPVPSLSFGTRCLAP